MPFTCNTNQSGTNLEKCSKCQTEDTYFVKYTDLHESWSLCRVCNTAFCTKDQLMGEFMKPDFGKFPINKITKEMILARTKRANGQGALEKKLNQKVDK